MEHIYNTDKFQLKNTAVCLGKFDGIHKGHRLLISEVVAHKELKSVVFTFALHPSNLFSNSEVKLIDTFEEKFEKLEKLGIDTLISYPFTAETASMEPEEFVKEVIVKKLDAKLIVVGKDFHFGHKRKGDVSLLKALSDQYGFKVIAFDKLEQEEKVVSSTRIRKEIQNGNMELVEELLGVPYAFEGEVLHGQKLGRTIDMPTINQAVGEHKILPPLGVYVSKILIENKVYYGITNVGKKPTVNGEAVVGVETNIFDFSGDLYGKEVRTELLKFVRPEQKFKNVEFLKKQMYKDKAFGMNFVGLQSNKTMLS
ncbi:MAG: bifunctional riboflavin kinase/FAD synthetase [Lachnospiraceae bacterium]|nr:bifunctional riboflavin kinase/FAD synthetase [Lachnospiraceae bacterium]